MSNQLLDQLLLPSILDRLLDDEPDNRKEVEYRGQSLAELKKSVIRDLENLLNTRIPFQRLPANSEHLRSSLWNYGIPDLSSVVLESSKSLEVLRLRIEEAIKAFEPRFVTNSVSVKLNLDKNAKLNRTIRFTIDGALRADPVPEPVSFSSILSTMSNDFQVQDAK
jgi:type VI secretion system protein ImpF